MLDFLLCLLGNDAPGSTGYLVDLYDDGECQREKGANSKNNDEPPLRFGGDPVDAARKSRRFFDLRCDLVNARWRCGSAGDVVNAEGMQDRLMLLGQSTY
jgi:hypothetical protein